MNARTARLLTRLYPPAWRERYGEEFAAMLESGEGGFHTLRDSVWAAVREHVVPTYRGGYMDAEMNSFGALMKRPSAYVPVTMSVVAFSSVLVTAGVGHALGSPIDRDQVEEHIWQLLMTVQMPIVLFFAVKWLRRAPRQTVGILAVQAGAWLASCAPVYFLHLG